MSNHLSTNKFGFRKCHSSYMALMAMMDNFIQALEKGGVRCQDVLGFL